MLSKHRLNTGFAESTAILWAAEGCLMSIDERMAAVTPGTIATSIEIAVQVGGNGRRRR